MSNTAPNLIESGHDFAFRIEPVADERLVASPLTDVRLIVVAAPAFIDTHGMPQSLADLIMQDRLILPSWVNIPRAARLLGPVVGDEPVRLERCHSANSEAAICEMTKAGMGATLMLDVLARPLIEDGTLIELLHQDALLTRKVYLVSCPRIHASRLQSLFADEIRRRYANADTGTR